MTPRARFWTAYTLLACAVLFRAVPFVWAVGTTVMALPFLLLNLAAVFALLRVLVRDAELTAGVAAIAALPLALPAVSVTARTAEMLGGTVALWLYALLLWVLRKRPFAFGTLLGLGMLHLRFAACAAAALIVMDAIGLISAPARRLYFEDRARHWALVVVAWVAVGAAAGTLQSFANAWGPIDDLNGDLCFAPETWAARSRLLLGDHLPRLVGGIATPPVDSDVPAGVYSGHVGIGALVGLTTLAGFAAGTGFWWSQRQAKAAAPISHVGGYLVLVGIVSTAWYGYFSCGDVSVETLDHNILAVFVPVGALVMALQAWRTTTARAALAVAVVLWCAANALDITALIWKSPAISGAFRHPGGASARKREGLAGSSVNSGEPARLGRRIVE